MHLFEWLENPRFLFFIYWATQMNLGKALGEYIHIIT